MLKSPWFLLFTLILMLWMAGCNPDPEFPVTPTIAFESVDFKTGLSGSENTPDTLIISVRFQDGNGDLGLGGEEKDPPYHSFDPLPKKSNGDPCLFSDRYDTVDCPGLPLEYDCINYNPPPNRIDEELINDTLYVKYNENYNNFVIELMTKKNGQFEVFDFREELCVAPLSGRFPRVKDDFNVEKPLEGVIDFKPPSFGFFTLFRNDTLKLRMRIKDRALHDSNVVESCEFTLNELLGTPDGECPLRP